MGGGGAGYKTGGVSEVLPLQKGEVEKVIAMLKGGGGGARIVLPCRS